MQIEIEPQTRAIERQDLLADLELARLPFKIETDRFGRILMSPPPAFAVSRLPMIGELREPGEAEPFTRSAINGRSRKS